MRPHCSFRRPAPLVVVARIDTPIHPASASYLEGVLAAAEARGPDQRIRLYPLDGSPGRDIPGLEPEEDPIRWTGDGRFLYVYRPGELPPKVGRLEVSTGRRESWKELPLPDPAGVVFVRPPQMTPDGEVCVYSYSRFMTELFLAEGLR